MQLISLFTGRESASIEVAGCNLQCPYCALKDKACKELLVQDILKAIASCREIAIGGGEPTLQTAELKHLLQQIDGKQIYLKSNGSNPSAIQELMSYVDKFILEIKAPFNDLDAYSKLTGLPQEEAARHLESLRETLSILQNKSYSIWIRVIPNFINPENLLDILSNTGKPSEVVLYQFLSNRSFDLPCYGYSTPAPSRSELELLATIAKKYVPRVVVDARAHRRCLCCE